MPGHAEKRLFSFFSPLNKKRGNRIHALKSGGECVSPDIPPATRHVPFFGCCISASGPTEFSPLKKEREKRLYKRFPACSVRARFPVQTAAPILFPPFFRVFDVRRGKGEGGSQSIPFFSFSLQCCVRSAAAVRQIGLSGKGRRGS